MIAALFGNLVAAILPSQGGGPASVLASPASLDAAQDELKQAKAELKAVQTELDKLAESQEKAEVKLEATRDQMEIVRVKTVKAEKNLTKLRDQLSSRLAEMYKNRGSDAANVLEAVFSSEDSSISGVVERMTMVVHLAQNDNELITNVQAKLDELDQLATELESKKASEQEDAASYEAARDHTLQVLEDSKDDYNRLRQRVAQLEEQERQRQEAARKLAEAKAAAAKAAAEKAAAEKAAAAKAAAAAKDAASKSTTTTQKKTTTTTSHESPSGGSTGGNESAAGGGSGWVFPVQGANSFVDSFGAPRSGGRSHKGTDIMTARNTPLVAVVNGTISSTHPGNSGLGGITIHLRGDDGNTYYYAHLSSIKGGIKAGVRVKAGQLIGYAGNTGNASGGAVHLHFEIRPGGGAAINPYSTLVKYR